MKLVQTLALVSAAVLATGCSASLDYSRVQSLTCPELDVAVGQMAKEISAIAIRRGTVRSYDVPFWVLGANRAQQALVDRDSRRLGELKAAQDGIIAERRGRCG